MKISADVGDVKRQNRSRILKYIIENTVTSRQDIAKALKLSMPTVFSNVTELMEAGFLEETGVYGSTGGRKAKMLSATKGFRYVAGIDVTKRHIRMVLMDVSRNIVASEERRCIYEDTADYYQEMGGQLERLLDEYMIQRSRMIGVGISVPGILEPDRNMLLRSRILNVEDISLARFTQNIRYPAVYGNDANCAAYAEVTHQQKNAAYFLLSNTVGGAVYHDGKLSEGDSRRGGEFGHMIIHPGGRRCYCGKEGCVDAYCSAAALLDNREIRLEDFFDKLAAGDEDNRKRWDTYLENLAIAVTNVRMALDCSIILGGYVGGNMEPYLDEFVHKTKKYNNSDTDSAYLSSGKYKYLASAVGAAQIMADQYIDRLELL